LRRPQRAYPAAAVVEFLTAVLSMPGFFGNRPSTPRVPCVRGFYHFNAVSGDALSAQVRGRNLYIYDESGNAGRITISDVKQSNGVIHVVDSVLLPR
jgi:uncharacterized surface protein with fasciclin (FAS1) repeats